MKDVDQFENRKRDHIELALQSQNQADGYSGLDRLRLHHDSLPELDFDEIDLSQTSLGKAEKTPFFIAGMTAGHSQAHEINMRLAQAAAERGWSMGVGSQRRQLEDLSLVDRWKEIRKQVPHLTLVANLGLAQVIDTPVDTIRRVVESLEAQALAIHLNPLQEALQPEGTPYFYGGKAAIENLVKTLNFPVIIKETGCGFSPRTLRKLVGIEIAAIDVSGLGGTHWGRIEGGRSPQDSLFARAARTFAHWGESTVDSVVAARSILKNTEIWASGGVRSGLDAAKLVALGAHRVGFAQPALLAALESFTTTDREPIAPILRWMEQIEFEMKVALLCTGCATPRQLQLKEEILCK